MQPGCYPRAAYRLRTSLLSSAVIERSAETSLFTALRRWAPPIARYPLRRATTAGRRRAGTSSRLSSRTRPAPSRSATESEPRPHAPRTPSARGLAICGWSRRVSAHYDRMAVDHGPGVREGDRVRRFSPDAVHRLIAKRAVQTGRLAFGTGERAPVTNSHRAAISKTELR